MAEKKLLPSSGPHPPRKERSRRRRHLVRPLRGVGPARGNGPLSGGVGLQGRDRSAPQGRQLGGVHPKGGRSGRAEPEKLARGVSETLEVGLRGNEPLRPGVSGQKGTLAQHQGVPPQDAEARDAPGRSPPPRLDGHVLPAPAEGPGQTAVVVSPEGSLQGSRHDRLPSSQVSPASGTLQHQPSPGGAVRPLLSHQHRGGQQGSRLETQGEQRGPGERRARPGALERDQSSVSLVAPPHHVLEQRSQKASV